MVVVGTDAHKYSHTFVATDEVGRQLGEKTVKATTAGHATAIMWAREQFGLELIWASRTAATCRRVWSVTYWRPASRWCGYPPS